MDATLVQDNRITSARYELNLIEKKILYHLIKEIRDKHVTQKVGDTTLFNDMIIKTDSKTLLNGIDEKTPKRVKEAFKSLRSKSFEWQNEYPEDHELHEWFEVGFINYGKWERGGKIEFEISRQILPFFVELTYRFTEYSLLVAMSLKSKWSQRFYEICAQWKSAGGRNITIKELRNIFQLEDKYEKYASLKKFVIDVAHKELKKLYKQNESDLYFEYSELKNGRSVEAIRMKIINRDKNKVEAKDVDMIHLVREQLYSIFEVEKKPKNKEKIQKLMSKLILESPKDLTYIYGKITYTKDKIPKGEWQRYLRAVFNEEYSFNNL